MNGVLPHVNVLVVNVLQPSDDALRSFMHRSYLSCGDLVLALQLGILSIQGRVLLHLHVERGGLRAERPSVGRATLIDPSHVGHLIGVAAPDLSLAMEGCRVVIVAICNYRRGRLLVELVAAELLVEPHMRCIFQLSLAWQCLLLRVRVRCHSLHVHLLLLLYRIDGIALRERLRKHHPALGHDLDILQIGERVLLQRCL